MTIRNRPTIWLVGLALWATACGGAGQTGQPDQGGDPGSGGAQGSGGGGGGGGGGGSGPTALAILPTKIYSGFDGVNSYTAPIIAVGGTNLTWSAADPSLADMMPSEGGTKLLVTTKKAGQTTLTITTADGKHATAELIITAYTPEQQALGQSRYGMAQAGDPACSSCHAGVLGPDHTPTLLEVDADAQIINTFLTGIDPEGHPIPTAKHSWNVTEPQKLGLVAFLRSLPPRGYPNPNAL